MTDLLKKAKEDQDSAFQQKAKIIWLTMSHENTKFFHQSIRHINRSNTINVLHIVDEVTSNQERIREIFQKYYRDLFCTNIENRRLININVIHQGPVLTETQQQLLTLSFSEDEIKKTVWSIPEDKALASMASIVAFTK